MFVLISLWTLIARIPYATQTLPWKQVKLIDYLSKNYLVARAGLIRSKAPTDFVKALLIGDKKPDAETFINKRDLARFLKRLSDLAKERKFEEARTIGENSTIGGSFENFRNYSSLIATAHEQNASVIEEICDFDKNLYRVRIKAKRFIDSENKKTDELVLENGRLIEANGFPIRLNLRLEK